MHWRKVPQIERQGLLWRGVGTDRVSRLVYCPAGFAFSRLTNTIARSGILGI